MDKILFQSVEQNAKGAKEPQHGRALTLNRDGRPRRIYLAYQQIRSVNNVA